MNQEVTEQELIRKNVAPRVTMAAIEDAIIAEHYFTAYEGKMGSVVEGTYETKGRQAGTDKDLQNLKLLTFCVLVLDNGFTVHGVSACASPENFDRDIGQRIARENAFNQIWPLMGYELKTRLHNQEMMADDDALGRALTFLLAHSFGNTQALSPEDSRIILTELIPQNVESNEDIARIAHEANRSWCEMNGDFSQVPWEQAAQWQKDSAVEGVKFIRANPDAGDSATHDRWLAHKEADGWVYGEVKDADRKTHPCMVPFEELPHEQQFKDKLFRSIVNSSLKSVIAPASARTNHLKIVG